MSQPEAELDAVDPLELAARLFKENYTRCFWHMRRDLPITRESIPLVLAGLRTNGGRRAYLTAARLASAGA